MRIRRGGRAHTLAVSLMGWFSLSLVLGAVATATAAPEFLSSFGPDGTVSSEFERARSVAIDQQSGAIYVVDGGSEGSVFKFDGEGHPLAFTGSAPYISGNKLSLPVEDCFACVQVAVDSTSHDVYVTSANSVKAFQADGEAAEFTAGPGAGTSSIGGFGEISGLAVDLNGAIYASDSLNGIVHIYAHSGEEITQFSVSQPGNLAVDTNGTLYLTSGSGGVRKFTPSAFPVTPTTTYSGAGQPFDPNSSRTVAVDPGNNNVYIGEISPNRAIARYDESGTRLATFAGPEEEGEVSEPLGIAIVGASGRAFVADGAFPNSGHPSQVEAFGFVPGPPAIRSTSVSDVTADSATLMAKINPDSFDTTYWFEYGLEDCAISACTSVPLGGADIGAGHEAVFVAQGIAGLEPGTTYHFRVVAKNAKNTTKGPDRTFMTQLAVIGFELADSRAWEMVSPPDKRGALLEGSSRGYVQAAADGGGLTYPSIGSIEADPEGNRSFEVSSVLARRTASGWQSKDITPHNDVVEGLDPGSQGQFKVFSLDLEKAALEEASRTPLSPGGALEAPYLRVNTEPAKFTSLVSEESIPPDASPASRPKIGAASPDLSHIGLKSEVPLGEEAPPLGRSLYLWTAGRAQPVSMLPAAEGGHMIATERFGSKGTVRHAISDDGSRVFWSTQDETALYLRDTQAEKTVQLDAVKSGSGTGPHKPIFQGASGDGTVVFFTDSQHLTDGASPEGADLYRCEIPAGSPTAGCASLTDVSAPVEGSGESAEVEGLVLGLSEDASTVYFVARAVLDDEANEFGNRAVLGRPNLYLWRKGSGVHFIATLSEKDKPDWGGPEARTSELSAAASPDGRYLAFASRLSLTERDNLDTASGERVEQVFRYDASSGRLDCLSCNPTGAAPNGMVGGAGTAAGLLRLVDPRKQWTGERIGAVLPEPPINQLFERVVLYNPRTVLDNGRVFFNAFDSLVPSDSNGQWDVYQYEPTGVGNCTASSASSSIVRSGGGCISLISSGTGEEEAGFLDASASGDDVFFLTPAQLNEPDEDQEYDVYDARVNGVPSTLPSHVECLGEACQPLPVAPNDPTPASAAFEGPGNQKQKAKHCPKGRRKLRRHGKTVCVRTGHKRHHRRQGKRSSVNSRGDRR